MSPSTIRAKVCNIFNERDVTSRVPHTCLWTRFTMVYNGQVSDVWKVCGWTWYRFFYLYTYPVKFKYLPCVMVQEELVGNDPRASYEVTKSISIRMADTSSMVIASDEAELMENDISCAALADRLDSHKVPVLKWWLLWCCIHMWGLIPPLCVWNACIHSCFLSGLLRKRCKETELSFVRVLPCTTHQSPGILAHNTSIFRHFGTSTARSRNIVGTRLLRYITLQPSTLSTFLQNYTNPYHVLASEVQTSLVFPLNSIHNVAGGRSSGTSHVMSHSISRCN